MPFYVLVVGIAWQKWNTSSMSFDIPLLFQSEFLKLAVLRVYPAHRTRNRAHHDRLGLNDVAAELDTSQQVAIGDAGGGEYAIALHHFRNAVLLARVLGAHLGRTLPLFLSIEY